MFEDIDGSTIVGTKQVLRELSAGKLSLVYIAEDADQFLKSRIRAAAEEAGVEAVSAPGMKELGTACGIDVGAACAGIPVQTVSMG